jgi:hypothetical protein
MYAFFAFSVAHSFDFNQYKQGSLDELLQLPKPATGVDLVAPQKLRFRVVLANYGQACSTGFLKRAMIMLGATKEDVEQTAITKCITVMSEKGSTASLFIQDGVAEYLPKEVKLGQRIDIFCDFLFVGSGGPGLLVNEFQQTK